MPQSVIGPGMGVFTHYARVLDDDSPMTVKTALALINRVWGEIEDDLDAAFDPETQVALAWFSTYGFDARASGDLINVATAKDTTIEALFRSGVFQNLNGKAGLIPRNKLQRIGRRTGTRRRPSGNASSTPPGCFATTRPAARKRQHSSSRRWDPKPKTLARSLPALSDRPRQGLGVRGTGLQ